MKDNSIKNTWGLFFPWNLYSYTHRKGRIGLVSLRKSKVKWKCYRGWKGKCFNLAHFLKKLSSSVLVGWNHSIYPPLLQKSCTVYKFILITKAVSVHLHLYAQGTSGQGGLFLRAHPYYWLSVFSSPSTCKCDESILAIETQVLDSVGICISLAMTMT